MLSIYSLTVGKEQKSIDIYENEKILKYENYRSDVCIAIRGSKVVKAICELVIADFYLSNSIYQRFYEENSFKTQK